MGWATDAVSALTRGEEVTDLVKQATVDRLLIGNNVGKVNGWASRRAVLGRVVRVHPLGW